VAAVDRNNQRSANGVGTSPLVDCSVQVYRRRWLSDDRGRRWVRGQVVVVRVVVVTRRR